MTGEPFAVGVPDIRICCRSRPVGFGSPYGLVLGAMLQVVELTLQQRQLALSEVDAVLELLEDGVQRRVPGSSGSP
ncbi:hypothetical protein QP090_01260 [Actinomadura xylanilytica]|nr:hypothetical protein [Actinomadura xylanilytica]